MKDIMIKKLNEISVEFKEEDIELIEEVNKEGSLSIAATYLDEKNNISYYISETEKDKMIIIEDI